MSTPKKTSHAFTVDVEDWYHGTQYLYEDIQLSKRLDYGLSKLLDLLSKHNIKGTFFWLGKAAEENPDLLKKVSTLGHEIGCHGWEHKPVCDMSRNQFRNDTHRALSLISDLSQKTIILYRAPYFSITHKSLWILQVLVELGIQYDSSILPQRKGRYGIPNFSRHIVDVETKSGTLTEVPVSINRILGFSLPVSGGGFFRLYPYSVTYSNFIYRERKYEPTMFYIHPWELDPFRPSCRNGYLEDFKNTVGLHSTERKLNKLLNNFSFNTLSYVAENHGMRTSRKLSDFNKS